MMKAEIDLKNENFHIEEMLGSIINRAAIIIKKRLYSMVKDAGYDITPEEFALLSRLWETDGMAQTELVEKTLKDKTRVTRLLGGLAEKAYVSKKVDQADRRNYIVYLTEEGKEMRLVIIPIVMELMKQAVEGIDEKDLDVTKRVLISVFDNLNDYNLKGRK